MKHNEILSRWTGMLSRLSVLAGWRRGVQGAADKDSLHGQSGRAHHATPDFRQQSCALPLRGEALLKTFCFTNCFSQQRTDLFLNTKTFVVYDVRNEDLSVQNSHLLCSLVLSFRVISYLFVSFFYLKKVT